MRTIASTVASREEAETASRRLQALGIDSARIILRDLDEGDSQGSGRGGVLISAKVPSEHVAAATGILKGGSSERPEVAAAQPMPRGEEGVSAPPPPSTGSREAEPQGPAAMSHASEGFWVEEAEPATAPAPVADRSASAPASPRTPRPQPTAERAADAPVIQTRVGPAQEGGLATRRREPAGFSRLFVIAVLLAAFGLALGAFLGTMV